MRVQQPDVPCTPGDQTDPRQIGSTVSVTDSNAATEQNQLRKRKLGTDENVKEGRTKNGRKLGGRNASSFIIIIIIIIIRYRLGKNKDQVKIIDLVGG